MTQRIDRWLLIVGIVALVIAALIGVDCWLVLERIEHEPSHDRGPLPTVERLTP